MMVVEIKAALDDLSDPQRAAFLPRFFKSGKDEYAEGDIFIGVTVPEQRKIVKEFWNKISLAGMQQILDSKIHEHRHTALLMLVARYEHISDTTDKEQLVNFYLNNRKQINNWDLVDNSCYKVLGRHAFDTGNDDLLRQLALEENMWSKRIAVVATMYYVRRGEFDLLKELVLLNLNHSHDLMHKANGWLLREMGKKSEKELLGFLKTHYQKMPRTTLRYAIEKLDEDLRQDFLKGRI